MIFLLHWDKWWNSIGGLKIRFYNSSFSVSWLFQNFKKIEEDGCYFDMFVCLDANDGVEKEKNT